MAAKKSQFPIMLAALIVISVLVLAIGLIYWQRQMHIANNLKAEYDQKERKSQEITRELQQKRVRESELADIKRQLETLDKELVDYAYIPSYLKQIQEAARSTGNNIRSIQPRELRPFDLKSSPLIPTATVESSSASQVTPAKSQTPGANANAPVTEEQYQLQQITLDVDGTYPSVMRLLNTLRTFRKIVYVRSVNITPMNGEGGGSSITARLDTYAIIPPNQYKSDETRGQGVGVPGEAAQ